jgi:SAM-dependent methyltransferase
METMQPHHEEQHAANRIKEFLKQWPRLYYFVLNVFGPVYMGGLSPRKFLLRYPRPGTTVNLGSGAQRIAPDVVNIDITPYREVDVVADIAALPYGNGQVARIICDQTLEHVPNFASAVKEMKRILAAGGYCYIGTPFVYPFHASPSDFQRWTHVGLRELFADFEVVEEGTRGGPFSTLTIILCYTLATLLSFGSERLYWLIVYGSTFLFFPVRYLDVFASRLPFVIHSAPMIYAVFRKR